MDLHVEWQPPIPLLDGAPELIYTCDLDKIPADSGVYVFGRQFGRSVEALYVGKAESLRRRVKTQLQNVRLMMHVKSARNGRRIILIGRFRALQGQRVARCIPLIEKALIRYFLSEMHDLVNVQGTRLRQHTIFSAGARRAVPNEVSVER